MSSKNKHVKTVLIKVRIHIEIQDFTVGNNDFVLSAIQDIFWNVFACLFRQIYRSSQRQLKVGNIKHLKNRKWVHSTLKYVVSYTHILHVLQF